MKYKQIEDNILTTIGESKTIGETQIEISEEEYNNILSIIQSKPEDTESIVYMLNAETMQYEPYPRPEEPVIEPEATIEDYQSALSELGVNVSEES